MARWRAALGRIARAGIANVGPGWFPSVMGTGILAIGIMSTPAPFAPRALLAGSLWIVDTTLFIALIALWFARWASGAAPDMRADIAKLPAWGAPPMAAFTVAVGALLIGPELLPTRLCVALAQGLFVVGAVGALVSAIVVPLRLLRSHAVKLERVNGTWLLPVVPPIVASVPAAWLSPYWPAALRSGMLAFAYVMLGFGLVLAAIVIGAFCLRLARHTMPETGLVPATWIVIGPLGQSIAGFLALATAARDVWPSTAPALTTAATAYGAVAWICALAWFGFATGTTLHALREGLPFSLGWWAFTFPLGVFTAGSVALYHATGTLLYAVAAPLLLVLLAFVWSIIAVRTLRAIALVAADVGGARGDRQRGGGPEHPVTGVA